MTDLSQRIASALNDEASPAKLFSKLLLEIDAALPMNAKEIEATRVRMVDPSYPNPTIAKSALEKLDLERDRLKAASADPDVPISSIRFLTGELCSRWRALFSNNAIAR